MMIRAHDKAAGAAKKRDQREGRKDREALGRSRGDVGNKVPKASCVALAAIRAELQSTRRDKSSSFALSQKRA